MVSSMDRLGAICPFVVVDTCACFTSTQEFSKCQRDGLPWGQSCSLLHRVEVGGLRGLYPILWSSLQPKVWESELEIPRKMSGDVRHQMLHSRSPMQRIQLSGNGWILRTDHEWNERLGGGSRISCFLSLYQLHPRLHSYRKTIIAKSHGISGHCLIEHPRIEGASAAYASGWDGKYPAPRGGMVTFVCGDSQGFTDGSKEHSATCAAESADSWSTTADFQQVKCLPSGCLIKILKLPWFLHNHVTKEIIVIAENAYVELNKYRLFVAQGKETRCFDCNASHPLPSARNMLEVVSPTILLLSISLQKEMDVGHQVNL